MMDRIPIIYENAQAVVCVKPVGLLSQGSTGMVPLLSEQLACDIFPIHRLDQNVGGVMVYAKTARAAAALSRQLQNGDMQKEYLAVLKGIPIADSGLLEDLLLHDSHRNKSYVVSRVRKGVRDARLYYRVLNTANGTALVQVRLLTGRTHQIRAQFSSRGLPLLGDSRYGGGAGKPQLWSMAVHVCLPGEAASRFTALPQSLGGFSLSSPPDAINLSFLK